MTLPSITAEKAAERLREGNAILVDVREPDERAHSHIPGSTHLPLSRIEDGALDVAPGQTVLFHCLSGHRTTANALALAARVPGCEAYVVAGGLPALRQAGLPVETAPRQPLPLMRQVMIAAGGLALAGALGGALVDPWFHALSGLVGAGLVMAGTTGFCPMATLLAAMPWNRQPG